MMRSEKIGFVGVGRMGANMARRLVDVGYSVVSVYDSYGVLASELAAEIGAKSAVRPAEVAEMCDVIFTVVTDDAAMESIFQGPDSFVAVSCQGKLFINCATISPEAHLKAYQAVAAACGDTLAASMASSITQARQGTLYLMIGGEEHVFQKHEQLLRDISVSLRYVGSVEDAARIKALVNMVMNINTAGLAEGLGLGAALGLDLKILKEIFSQTGANSRVLETDGDDMIAREHDCYFSAAHAAKDSGIANALAKEVGLNVPLSEATGKQYQKLVDLGLGGFDKSAVAELTFEGRSGRGLVD